jgi:hypothetical protein
VSETSKSAIDETNDAFFSTAFVCPVKSCGRSFSVLSNMRRHARVHSQLPATKQPEPSSDEDSEKSATSNDPSALFVTGSTPTHLQFTDVSHQWHQRRGSGASTSSDTSSRQSHSYSSSEEQPDISARPEKR